MKPAVRKTQTSSSPVDAGATSTVRTSGRGAANGFHLERAGVDAVKERQNYHALQPRANRAVGVPSHPRRTRATQTAVARRSDRTVPHVRVQRIGGDKFLFVDGSCAS